MLKSFLKYSLYYPVILFTLIFTACSSNDEVIEDNELIFVLVESSLYKDIEIEIARYKEDLIKEGYDVRINGTDISSQTPPQIIRNLLIGEYSRNNNLTGSVFIGNIQAPFFNISRDLGDAYWHDYLADFYYMDLDGIWSDSNNDGILDDHKETEYTIINKVRRKLNLDDYRKPEIWVSRIRSDKLISLGEEAELIMQYFDKNHNYRTNQFSLPPKRAFAVSAGVDFSKSEWGAYPETLYSDIRTEQFHPHLNDSLKKILSSDTGYQWGVINVFSGPRIHHFNHFNNEINPEWWKTAEGREKIAEYSDEFNESTDVGWMDIKMLEPNILFYHLFTSEVGRHDFQDYLGGMYIFSGSGLAAIAGTQHSGSVGIPLLYQKLAEGKSLGYAWKRSLDWLMENNEKEITIVYYPESEQKIKAGKSKYKAVLLGDGTLKLPQ